MPNPPRAIRHLAALATLAGCLTAVHPAAAAPFLAQAPEPSVPRGAAASPFVQLVEDGHAWMNATLTGAGGGSRKPSAVDGDARKGTLRGTATASLLPPALLVPQVGLFVRDWRSSVRLAGAATTVLDDVRPSASARMVLVRIASGDVVAPFLQVGVGQWRLDPHLFPSLASETELAGQIGGGLELRLARVSIAVEAHETAIYRERRAGQTLPGFPSLIGGSLAARGSF